LVQKRGGKRLLEGLGHRFEENIEIDLKVSGWEVADWIHLAEDRDWWWAVMTIIMNLHIP
jgi:hypothetical protein